MAGGCDGAAWITPREIGWEDEKIFVFLFN
jgi:hypothetical protein